MSQPVNLNKQMDNQSRALSAIGYLGWLVLIPILAVKNPNNFVKRHINCSLTILIISLLLSLTTIPVTFIFTFGVASLAYNGFTLIFIIGLLLFIIDMGLVVAISITQWVCLIRAALGYEASLWLIKIHNFVTVD